MSGVRITGIVQGQSAAPSEWELTLSDGRERWVHYRHRRLKIGFGKTIDEAVEASVTIQPDPPFAYERECLWEDVESYVVAALGRDIARS